MPDTNALTVETGNDMKIPSSRILNVCARPLFASLLMSGTVLSAFIATPATAQAAPQAVAVNIPAGGLANSLNRLAVQTGLQIAFDASVTSGLSTSGRQGNHDTCAGACDAAA